MYEPFVRIRTVRGITIPPKEHSRNHRTGGAEMAEKIRSEEFVFLMKKISIDLELLLEKMLGTGDLSGTQVYLMVYILRHHPEGTYITELCHEIGVSKATVSVLIKKLREKGYLYFESHSEDIRKKKVMPTKKLWEESSSFLERAEEMEQTVCKGMNQQEKEKFWKLEQKLLLQLGEME